MLPWREPQPRAELPRILEVVPIPDAGHYGCRGCGPHTGELHQLARSVILFRYIHKVFVVLADAFVQATEMAQHVSDCSVAPARQILQYSESFPAHSTYLERQRDPE